MVPVFVKDGIEFKAKNKKGGQEREPEEKSPVRFGENKDIEVLLPND